MVITLFITAIGALYFFSTRGKEEEESVQDPTLMGTIQDGYFLTPTGSILSLRDVTIKSISLSSVEKFECKIRVYDHNGGKTYKGKVTEKNRTWTLPNHGQVVSDAIVKLKTKSKMSYLKYIIKLV